jgi:hypothetical protein
MLQQGRYLPRDAQRAALKPQMWLQIVLRSIRGFGVALLPGHQPTIGEERQVLGEEGTQSPPS